MTLTLSCAVLVLCAAVVASRKAMEISGVAGYEKNNYYGPHLKNILYATYGDRVDIFCSGAHVLVMSLDGVSQDVKRLNATTVQLSVTAVTGVYIYTCRDVETAGEVSLNVAVLPEITVTPSRRYVKRNPPKLYSFVPIGEDFEVMCSSDDADSLSLTLNLLKNPRSEYVFLETEVVNDTTVKSKKQSKLNGVYDYTCDAEILPYIPSVSVDVYVDHPPAATGFWCIEYTLWQVRCSWTVLSMDTTFTMHYTDEVGNSVELYKDLSNKKTVVCDWNLHNIQKHGIDDESHEFTLAMRACNLFFCTNETFHINRLSITKIQPPVDLTVLNVSSLGTIISWRIRPKYEHGMIPIENKVTYRIPGIQPRELDGFSLRENCTMENIYEIDSPGYIKYLRCERKLRLPCPSTLYQISVYTRLTKTPKDDAYWSDPATITVRTNSDGTANDPICDTQSELVNTPDRALFKVEELAREFRVQGAAFNKKLEALKQKRAKINAARSEL